jgi:hypothetical protein
MWRWQWLMPRCNRRPEWCWSRACFDRERISCPDSFRSISAREGPGVRTVSKGFPVVGRTRRGLTRCVSGPVVLPSVVFGIGLITGHAAVPAAAKTGSDEQWRRLGKPCPTGMLTPVRGCRRRVPLQGRAGGWCLRSGEVDCRLGDWAVGARCVGLSTGASTSQLTRGLRPREEKRESREEMFWAGARGEAPTWSTAPSAVFPRPAAERGERRKGKGGGRAPARHRSVGLSASAGMCREAWGCV